MEQFKRAKVVMLPTENKSSIYQLLTKKLFHFKNDGKPILGTHQHLHIISDDEIKEGDSILNTKTGKIEKELGKDEIRLFWEKEWKVIISSTDKSLGLSQPSQQFIEKYIESYNKNKIITDVLVEYECVDFITDTHTHIMSLKINPKDNTITIKKVKDSWNREELRHIIDFIKELTNDDLDRISPNIKTKAKEKLKWIEENL